MIGIDLNDLSDPLLKERDENALRLILHPDDDLPNVAQAFWYLWTAKEAVFKAKRDLASFSPKELPISLNQAGAKWIFTSGDFEGIIVREEQLIYAVANRQGVIPTFKIFERKTEDDSGEVRESLLQYLKKEQDINTNVTQDGNGLPILGYRNLPVSFTHHHRYLGFAFPKLTEIDCIH